MNNEFKRMQQLAGIKEITLRPASRTLSDQDINDINLAFNDFGAGHSEQDFTKPVTEYRTALDFGEGRVINGVLTDFEPHDNPDDFPEYQAFLRLLAKPPGYYITYTLFPNSPQPPAPGAPQNAFYFRLGVGPNSYYKIPGISLSMPDVDDNGISVGWFDVSGNYQISPNYQ
jgi:hypothetical protein